MRCQEIGANRYGAFMGRPLLGKDKSVPPEAAPFSLRRVYLDRGGYDPGGAYWGLGAPLYEFAGPDPEISGFVRGRTREAAKAEVRKFHPSARFFR